MKEDYYEILGVDKTSDVSTIKNAYRKLAMKYHPDKNKGDKKSEELFKKITEAYSVLSDQKKRELYDLHGHAGVESGSSNYSNYSNVNFGDIFGDIFGDVFGKTSQQAQNKETRGSDIVYNINLDLKDAIIGTTLQINVTTLRKCNVCDGTGAKKDTKKKICESCSGVGEIRVQHGFFSIQRTCTTCGGSGNILKENCLNCLGDTRIKASKVLSIKIPAGVDNGDKIRLLGEGECGKYGGHCGDLYIQISVKDHSVFSRDNEGNLCCEVPVSLDIAIFGGIVKIPTFFGIFELRILPYTQTGNIFKIQGKGSFLTRFIFCKIFVEIPTNLTEEQINLFRKFVQNLKSDFYNYPKIRNWEKLLKEFFK